MHKSIEEIISLVEVNLKVRYRQTFIGFVWVILNPIILFLVQGLLFSQILKNSNSSYYFYLLSGLLPWFYLSQTAEMGCNYLKSNAGLLKNLKIHPFKLIMGLALENFINLLAASLIIYSVIYFSFGESLLSFLIYLFFSPWILILVIFITFISSVLNVVFRDTNYILHFLFTILYFMTPTFYYPENLPPGLAQWLKLNPFYWIISLFRIRDLAPHSLIVIEVNLLIMAVLAFLAWFVWKKFKNSLYLKL